MSTSDNLTTEQGLKNYLSSTPFVASRVTTLVGGLGNFTYRIALQEPHAYNGYYVHTMVAKHAEPYVATDKDFPLSVERQEFEALALRHVPEFISPSPVISLPAVFYEDRVNRVILMEDAGESSLTLKALLLKSPPSVEMSHVIGRALGTFLAELHVASHHVKKYSSSLGIILKEQLSKNTQARTIGALISYGWLVSTISPLPDSPPLVMPPLDNIQIQRIKDIARRMQAQIMESNEVLVMGDFWPGNIVVSLDPSLRVKIVDWELAKPGLAGLDIGQCLAELHQMQFFYPASKDAVIAITSSFTAAYREVVIGSGIALDLVEVARLAASRAGTHMVVLTPRIPTWAKGEEKQREIMAEGIDYIIRAHEGDDDWLRESIVGGLLP